MKTSNVYCEVIALKDKAILNFKIDRTSDESFNMGNSSLLINFNPLNFSNPICTYQNSTFSTKDYEPIEVKTILKKILGIQFRVSGIGKPVSKRLCKLLTVEFDLVGKADGISWRLIDSAVVTPNFETVDTKFLLKLK
jgi:hypothetical protein